MPRPSIPWSLFLLAVVAAPAAEAQRQAVPAPVQQGRTRSPEADARAARFAQLGKDDPELAAAVVRAQTWLEKQRGGKDGVWTGDAGIPAATVQQTALASLALLATGNSIRHGDHKDAMRETAKYFHDQQETDGRFAAAGTDGLVSPHALASWAMAESQSLSQYTLLLKPVTKAAGPILVAMAEDGCWCVGGEPDAMATALAVIALQRSNALLDDAGKRTNRWLLGMTAEGSGRIGWRTRGGPPPVAYAGKQASSPMLETATAAGLYARLVCGETLAGEGMLQGVDLLRHAPPRWDDKAGTVDPLYWCFGARVAWRAGGECWKEWQGGLRREVLGHQVADGDDAGSWPPQGPWGEKLGRVGTTALIVLALTAQCAEPPPAGG